jgi:hypothetical protein
MFERKARVLIILPRDLVDRARGLAGRATISMKLPVSLANVSRQAEMVRRIRSEARRRPMAPCVAASPRTP